jgi:phosphoribosylanthranilate isomerase
MEAGLDLVQLHGGETSESVAGVGVPAFKALRPRADAQAERVIAKIREFRAGVRPPAAVMVEGFSEIGLGGTGTRADWTVAAEINASEPILLGGGLDPENVGTAIRRVRPLGVDVSSGVETNGVKDPAKIEAFIRAARRAFRV